MPRLFAEERLLIINKRSLVQSCGVLFNNCFFRLVPKDSFTLTGDKPFPSYISVHFGTSEKLVFHIYMFGTSVVLSAAVETDSDKKEISGPNFYVASKSEVGAQFFNFK